MKPSALRIKVYVLGVLLLIGIPMIFDADIQRAVQGHRSTITDELSKMVKPLGDGRLIVPVFIGVSVLGGVLQVPSLVSLGLTTLGALSLDGLLTGTLQAVLGRQRPFKGKGPNSYDPFREGGSFPSGHTSVAFNVATVLSTQYKSYGVVPALSYSLAGLVGFSRINDNKHFASDVLAGAVVGIMTARFALQIRKNLKQTLNKIKAFYKVFSL
jgi:membrane-associated phospholipid phosphatase